MYFFKKGAYLFIKNENAKEIFLLFTSLAYIMYAYKRMLIFSQVIFFRSPFSIIVNMVTPVAVLIYLLLIIKHRKKLKNKLYEQYQNLFSKN